MKPTKRIPHTAEEINGRRREWLKEFGRRVGTEATFDDYWWFVEGPADVQFTVPSAKDDGTLGRSAHVFIEWSAVDEVGNVDPWVTVNEILEEGGIDVVPDDKHPECTQRLTEWRTIAAEMLAS